jgi:tetratricopeptide (TPR) repeat protein
MAKLEEYNTALAARDYETAVAALQCLLAGINDDPKTQSLKIHLESCLESAQADLDAQNEARQKAKSHVAAAEKAMASKQFDSAAVLYEEVVALDVNDSFLTASYRAGLDAARIKVAGEQQQREVLRKGREAQVEQYNDAIEAREYERAIVVLKKLLTGLPLQAETDGLRTHLAKCLAAAEADLAAQDSARRAAQTHAGAAEAAMLREDFSGAISLFDEALSQDVNDSA